jgi:hypothetical protein
MDEKPALIVLAPKMIHARARLSCERRVMEPFDTRFEEGHLRVTRIRPIVAASMRTSFRVVRCLARLAQDSLSDAAKAV